MEPVDLDQTSLPSIKQENVNLEDHLPDVTVLETCAEIKTEPEFIDVEKIDAKYSCVSSIKVEEDPGDPLRCDKEVGEPTSGVKKDPEIPFVSCGELIDKTLGSGDEEGIDYFPGDIIPASVDAGRGSQIPEPTSTGKKTFTCSECKSCFSRAYALTVHRRTHTGERPFACGQCESTFTTSSHLRRHIKSHLGKKPFKCVQCNSSFTELSSLRVHMKRHSGEKPFACPECPMTFCRQNDLKIHSRTHSGERPFSCSICHSAFSQSSNLKEHMKTHTGERPYSCTVCPNTYIRSTDLKIHMRTHSGERPFSCSECPRTFISSCYLLRHKKTHSVKCRPSGLCQTSFTRPPL